jgi:hypothetical protein
VVVLLGTPNAESSRLYALTVTEGDPSWAGPLAGKALKLPVYHITEAEVKAQIPGPVYQEQVALAEMVIEVGEIAAAVSTVRNQNR